MKDRKKILITIFVFSILFIIIFCLDYNKQSVHRNNIKYDVYIIPSQQNIFLDGEVQYCKKLNFTEDETKGTIDKISVEDKDWVKKGQTLFTYKNEQMIEQYETLTQQIDNIEIQANTVLNGQNNIQASDINSQKSSLKQQLNDIKDKRYTTISAPFNGIVSRTADNKDNTIKIVLTLIDPKMQVIASANEKDVLKLKANQKIKLNVYGTNKELNGTISSISTEPSQVQASQDATASKLTQTAGANVSYYPVYINIDNQQEIYPGFHVQGTTVDESELPKIPSSSIFGNNRDRFVWLVENKKLRKVPVKIDKYNSTYMQVKSGLNFDDKIIKNPSGEMKEGDIIDTASSGN